MIMPSELQLIRAWQGWNENYSAFILFEGGALSQEVRQSMLSFYKDRCVSLYKLPDLKKVEAYGPWLARINEERELNNVFSEEIPVAGIIFSALSLTHLSSRLAIGCIAQLPDSRNVLLRFYTPHVLRHLIARPDMDWHPVLFSQVKSWWVQENFQWQSLNIPTSGTNHSNANMISFDETLWSEVEDRSDVSALLREWSTMKSSSHFPPCIHRSMVEKALYKAQKVGLTRPLDQKIYALSYLNGKKEYLESIEFQTVLENIKNNGMSLSDLGRG